MESLRNSVCYPFSKKSNTLHRSLLWVSLTRNESHRHPYWESSRESEERACHDSGGQRIKILGV